MLNPEKTYIWYDGFSVPKEKRDEAFRFVPEIIKRCDFMIILAPGCTHFDKIDPRTGRKKNLCYRTYRLNARCVFEVFCAFLTTKGGEQVRPALLVRSGQGTPNWISPLECQKLAVGTSTFDCCANNHSKIKECRRSLCLKSLDQMIERRARSLFLSNNFAEARFTLCLRNYWCRGLIDDTTRISWNTIKEFKKDLYWLHAQEDNFIDREGFHLLGYASATDCVSIVREVLMDFRSHSGGTLLSNAAANEDSDPNVLQLLLSKYKSELTHEEFKAFVNYQRKSTTMKWKCIHFVTKTLVRTGIAQSGLMYLLALWSGTTALNLAVGRGDVEIVKILLENGADPYVENDLGMNAFELCEKSGPSPSVLRALQKH